MSIVLERERTYIAKQLPAGLSLDNSVFIRDVYIPQAVSHARLRLRQRDDIYEATKKIPVDGDASHQQEHTIPLTQAEFEALASCSNKSLQKRRYFTKIDGYDAEVDVYEGALQGLVVIDFEFATEEEFERFSQPDSVLADLTHDEVVGGGFLAGKSFADIEKRLHEYGYKKIETMESER